MSNYCIHDIALVFFKKESKTVLALDTTNPGSVPVMDKTHEVIQI